MQFFFGKITFQNFFDKFKKTNEWKKMFFISLVFYFLLLFNLNNKTLVLMFFILIFVFYLFNKSFKKSLLFKNVEVRYATQRKTQTGELTDFEIICKLTSVSRGR